MSVYKNKNGRTVRRDAIPKGQQWTWWTIEMMESPAYRALSLSAHRVIARIRIELAHHGGRDNGKLPVTFQDFEKFGIHRHSIAPAIREAEALGWIRTTQLGRSGNGEFRIPNMFALTHLDTEDGKASPNDWSKIEKLEEAEAIAAVARKAPPRFGKFSRRTAMEKQNASVGKCTSSSVGKCTSESKLPVSESAPLSPAKTAPLSISRVPRVVYRWGDLLASAQSLTSKPVGATSELLRSQPRQQ
jgi:hypothetical protein